MEDALKTVEHETECEMCGGAILAGASIYPVIDTNAYLDVIPLEEIHSIWIFDCCKQCYLKLSKI